jgi:hypothetical protein
LPCLYNFASEYVIRKAEKRNQEGLELNGTLQLLVYIENVHLLNENIDTLKKKKSIRGW